ncbi:MAG: carbohydrate ABC transporter permease [Spirochaetia bacterium]|nr:carbohydrate ABC transporter permease [Spirochaetia bacterium]
MKQNLRNKIFLYFILAVMAAVIIFPVYFMILASFQPTTQAMTYPPNFFFKSFSFEKIITIMRETDIFRWIGNSFIVSLGVVVVNLVVSVPAAYSIARYKIPFNRYLLIVILVTQMIPSAIMVVPLFEIFASAGMIDRLFSLILSNTILTLPLGTWILIGFFENIPQSIEEAALMDGVSKFGLFFKINVPLIYPALVTVAIIIFFDTWNEYMYAYSFITSQENWVGTVGVASLIGQFRTDWQGLMITSLLFSIFPMTIYIFLRNYIVRGVSEGFAK